MINREDINFNNLRNISMNTQELSKGPGRRMIGKLIGIMDLKRYLRFSSIRSTKIGYSKNSSNQQSLILKMNKYTKGQRSPLQHLFYPISQKIEIYFNLTMKTQMRRHSKRMNKTKLKMKK